MKNKLAILGMGGHSNVIEEIARSSCKSCWSDVE